MAARESARDLAREQEPAAPPPGAEAPASPSLDSLRSVSSGCLSDFYAQAEPLGADPGHAWVLRSETDLEGTPIDSGVFVPGDKGAFDFLDVSLARVLNRGVDFEGMTRENLAFFDLETTGLMGGTGTYPFLIGLGYFKGPRFVVEQYFMEDFPDEPEMLEALARRLREFSGLVSFNGKSFDAPLLRTRFLMNRMPSPVELPHLDLLHCARRLWKGRLESCSFGSIERSIFNIRRVSDVPGSMIPRIYVEYARGIRRQQIIPVIDHNAQDVVSMAALFALFCKWFRQPESSECQHRTDQAGLASWHQRAGQPEEAVRCMERAALACREPDEEHAMSMHVATMYRRIGRWTDAVDIWRERVRVARGACRVSPCIELAKYYEHQTKEHGKALEWARRALAFLESRRALAEWLPDEKEGSPDAFSGETGEPMTQQKVLNDAQGKELDALLKRLRRLEKKSAR